MFSQSFHPEVNFILTGLLIIWATLLFGGFILGKPNAERTRRMPTWTRLASSFTLVVAAGFWILVAQDLPSGCLLRNICPFQFDLFLWEASQILIQYALFIAIGMLFGFIGDIFMSRKILIGGIGSFGFGHIAYIFAFLNMKNFFGPQSQQPIILNNPTQAALAWIIWLIIGVIAWYITVYRATPRTPLHWAALAYCLLLSSTAGFATGLALQQAVFIPLAIGAALFLFSDLLITVQLFMHKSFYLIDDVVWLTYGPAQMLIVYSVYAAMLVVS